MATKAGKKKGRSSLQSASSRDPRYKTAAWKEVREYTLYNDPTCYFCPFVGTFNPSSQVDHIVKASEYDGDFYDLDNLVGCCASCHSSKTSYESKGVRFDTKKEWAMFMREKKTNHKEGY